MPLSSKGKEAQCILFEQLEEKGLKPQKIYTSPLLRAVQSAKILADNWNLPIIEEPALGNAFNTEEILKRCNLSKEETPILFAGHAGQMDQLIEILAGDSILFGGLPKSGTAILNFSSLIGEENADSYEILNPGAI